MKVYTLGTGHGDSTFSRFNSSTLYEADDGTLYLVDAGAPCEALIRRKGLQIKDLRCAFITHMHSDHCGGLSGVISQAVKYNDGREQPLAVFLPESGAIEPFKAWMKAVRINADYEKLEIKAFTDGLIYKDDNIAVTAIRTRHLSTANGEPSSFAFVLDFKKEGKRVLHTGDLRCDFSDFPKIALEEKFDVCVCEATHYSPNTALPVFEKCKFGRMIFSHIGDAWHIKISRAWQVDNGERRLLDVYKSLPYPVQIAHDGDEFPI